MLGASVDQVVVRTFAGAGHYGRSNGGNAGAEDEAVLLSQAVGKPVRVQWMRNDDLQWSTQSSAAFSDVELALDANGKLSAFQIDHFMPAMQDDRLIGAILAGLPTIPAPNENGSLFGMRVDPADPWVYDAPPPSSNAPTAVRNSAKPRRPSTSACAITACALPANISRTSRAKLPSPKPPSSLAPTRWISGSNTPPMPASSRFSNRA